MIKNKQKKIKKIENIIYIEKIIKFYYFQTVNKKQNLNIKLSQQNKNSFDANNYRNFNIC